jgi:hypothetical protein
LAQPAARLNLERRLGTVFLLFGLLFVSGFIGVSLTQEHVTRSVGLNSSKIEMLAAINSTNTSSEDLTGVSGKTPQIPI